MMHSDNPAPPPASAPPAVVWFRRSWGTLLGALMGTLICNILCLPLWTDYDVIGFFRTPWNKEACMEIIYSGPLTGADAFSITSSSNPSSCAPTNYHYGRGTQLYTANLRINKAWKSYTFTLKSHGKGMLQIMLGGSRKSNDYGEIYSIFSDYRNLRIGGKEIFSDQKKVSFSKGFSYRIPVNANDAIKISFDARRHSIGSDDFNLVHSKNFWYPITLSVAAFVIFCALMKRALVSCKSRTTVDAVFLFIFFLFLVIPVSNISDAKSCVREGRKLMQCPKVSLVLKESANYGKEYDDWFCDHLGGREWFLKLHDTVHREVQQIIRAPRAWYVQSSGWIFDNEVWHLGTRDLHSIVKPLAELGKFCRLNHIKLYVLVVPRKEDIYSEMLMLYKSGRERNLYDAEGVLHRKIQHMVAKQNVTYIYPQRELREASKQDFTFFKQTQHWTDWGAYVGYRALMKEVRRDFPNIPIVSLRHYNQTQSNLIRDEWDRGFGFGHLKKFFNFEMDLRRPATIYNYYDHKNADNLVLNMGRYTKDFGWGGGGVCKIMVIGTSQNENLMNFLPYSASQTKYIRYTVNALPSSEKGKIMKYYKKDILSYKPDALIFSISAAGVNNMLYVRDIFKE